MLLVSVVAFLLYLAFLGGFFYVVTNEIFIVKLNSGVWWFALLFYILLVILQSTVIFHPFRYSFYVRILVLISVLALTGVVIWLGLEYQPFQNVQLSDRIGALFDSFGTGVDFDNLPPAVAEVTKPMPEALNQGNACNSCWAYAAAAALGSMAYEKDRVVLNGCASGRPVQDWVVSPQAMVDLDTVGKCAGSYTAQGLRLAAANALPSSRCVPGYSSRYVNSSRNCGCNGPSSRYCLLAQTGKNFHSRCSNASEPFRTDTRFVGKTVSRVNGNVDNMKKAISYIGPLVVWVSFYSQGYPIWTLYQKSALGEGFSLKNSNYIARPRDDPNYRIETNGIGHAMVIYGYGKNEEGVEFWQVRNSWGRDWGYQGSVNIELGVNAWGIESDVFVLQ